MGRLEVVPELDSAKKWKDVLRCTTSVAFAIAFFLELDRMHGVTVDLPEASEKALYTLLPREPDTDPRTGLPNDYPAWLYTDAGKVQVLSPLAQKNAIDGLEHLFDTATVVRGREQVRQDIDHWTDALEIVLEDYEKYRFVRYLEVRAPAVKKLYLKPNLQPHKDSLGMLFIVAAHVIQNWD